MDLLFLTDEFAIRLQAGAFGSLLAVVSDLKGSDVPATRRLLCGWIFAAFGAPFGSALILTLLGPLEWIAQVTRRDAEIVTAFFCGIVGWRVVQAINKRTENINFGNWKRGK